ncbi:TetR/AcrR family transcriptional regulator [Actinoplanes sp. CA-252034]|uniref:TetR/AcrR family transcriptional regulator n=1 Tax=Actinoplanes sp. CA-252034 TaxID=3239906 RepID=UPI003D99C833
MSELPRPPRRRLRADAERSRTAIIDAAIILLGRRADASMEEIAAAAGVARQTVYAHYPSRDALLVGVVDRITRETVAALDAIDPATGTAASALTRWLTVSWEVIERYPLLLTVALPAGDPADEHDRHLPIMQRLAEILAHGRRTGEFTTGQPEGWLPAATISLGHAAGQEVAAGRMTTAAAAAAYRDSVQRLAAAPVVTIQ